MTEIPALRIVIIMIAGIILDHVDIPIISKDSLRINVFRRTNVLIHKDNSPSLQDVINVGITAKIVIIIDNQAIITIISVIIARTEVITAHSPMDVTTVIHVTHGINQSTEVNVTMTLDSSKIIPNVRNL